MDDDTRRLRGAAFQAMADVYERTRPTYPDQAVDWLAGNTPVRVLELGAGTGKLTGSLRARDHDVVATDPSTAMLAQLRRRHPGTPALPARAEQLPFRSHSFDAVVVAQAFHWFDPALALPEISRVLRPQGTFALVWNLRDESVPWVRRLGAVIGSERASWVDDDVTAVDASGLFAPLDRKRFRFWQQLDRDGLLGLVESRSHVAVLGGDERSRVMTAVEALYDEYGRGHDGMRLPYVTHCLRTRRTTPAPPEQEPPQESPDAEGNLLFDFR